MCQSPRQLIERGTKAANEITVHHWDDLGCGCDLNLVNLSHIFKVGLLSDTVCFYGPLRQFLFKRLEVFIRPTGLHLDKHQTISERRHVEAKESYGTIGA